MPNNPQHPINRHWQLIHILQPQPCNNLAIILTGKRLRVNTREMWIVFKRVLEVSLLINEVARGIVGFGEDYMDFLELVARGFGEDAGELKLVEADVQVFELLADPSLLSDYDSLDAYGLEGVGDGDEETLFYCVLLFEDQFLAFIL